MINSIPTTDYTQHRHTTFQFVHLDQDTSETISKLNVVNCFKSW